MDSLIIFDLDGTLYNANNPITVIIDNEIKKYIMKERNLSNKEYINLEKSIPNLLDALEKLKINKKEFYDTIYKNIKYDNYIYKDGKLRDKLLNIKTQKIICTNSSKYHTMMVLNHLGICDLFLEIYSAEEYVSKQEMFKEIQKKFNLLPNQMVVIGNNYEIDILPAKQLGMKTIYINYENEIKDIYEALEKIEKE